MLPFRYFFIRTLNISNLPFVFLFIFPSFIILLLPKLKKQSHVNGRWQRAVVYDYDHVTVVYLWNDIHPIILHKLPDFLPLQKPIKSLRNPQNTLMPFQIWSKTNPPPNGNQSPQGPARNFT